MFQNLINFISRLFGSGKKNRDKPLPAPLPGSNALRIATDGKDRSEEARRILLAYVSAPYQIVDREIRIETVTWDEGKSYFISRGNKPENFDRAHIGHAYAPKAGFNETFGLIHLIDVKLDQQDRIKWAIHEFSHVGIYHWLLTADEWNQWRSRNASPEDFADSVTKRLLGQGLEKWQERFFDALEKRLTETGPVAQRL